MKENNEKFGTIVVDGKIINLDSLTPEELEQLKGELLKKEVEIRENIDKLLFEDDEMEIGE